MPKTAPLARPSTHVDHLRKDLPMYSEPDIAISIAHERQEHERRIMAGIRRARHQREARPIRERIGQRFIRLGERLIADPASEPVWSR